MNPKTSLRRTPIITSSEQVDCSPHLRYWLCAIKQQSGKAVYDYFFSLGRFQHMIDKRGDFKSKQ